MDFVIYITKTIDVLPSSSAIKFPIKGMSGLNQEGQ